ncbi:MAG: hybrid sensor histidine kinase/response regulator [Candidatus Hydrogenedentes bacterium]|nr:hybrid sensor histidine kinase/response regulator [Candidatus Hydrogenedentota bacterium]
METLRILLCDDEPGMRMAMNRALVHYTVEVPDLNGGVRFELTEAERGEAALQRIHDAPPDILLLDLKLPDMNGLSVLETIKAHQLPVLTLMITAYPSIEAAVRATKQGAFDFLPKPFTPSELRNAVRRAAVHLIIERQARALAEQKRRVRFEFLSVLAHELKAPINAIDGYLEVLQEAGLQMTADQYQNILGRCSTRLTGMRKLIEDLLDLTRIESGQRPRTLAPVRLEPIARTALDTARPAADHRGIQIALACPAEAELVADASELEIILNNLLSNAVKYNREGGEVHVRIAQQDGTTTIAVSDTGIGISKEDQARLFQEFTRIKTRETRKILGSGLGLSILKKLAHLYDGEVSVASEPGKGSTFTVTLKSAESASAAGGPGIAGIPARGESFDVSKLTRLSVLLTSFLQGWKSGQGCPRSQARRLHRLHRKSAWCRLLRDPKPQTQNRVP